MSANTPEPEPAETPQSEPDTPDTEPTPAEGDNLGDDRLAEMARPFLDQPETGDIEVHHGPPPTDVADDYSDTCPHGAKPGEPCDVCGAEQEDTDDGPLDMPDLRIGRSVFADLARESAGLYGEWPELPPPPAFLDGPDGWLVKYDEAKTENEDGFIADKVALAEQARAARARTFGSAVAA